MQLAKTSTPKNVTSSYILIDVKLVHSAKARLLIVVAFNGTVKLFKLEHL